MFENEIELAQWLKMRGIDTTTWGEQNTKSVRDLWLEVRHGESILLENPLVRQVHVVELWIEQNGRRLIEAEQEFSTGKRRRRNLKPAEKMKTGETPIDAARRGLHEELDVSLEVAASCPATVLSTSVETLTSPSYPGLQTCYHLTRVHLIVDDLPDEDFTTENLARSDGDPVIRQFWQWREIPV